MIKKIDKFKLPKHSWWYRLWCKHEWGHYWKRIDSETSKEQLVCRKCGKEKD